MPPLLFDPVYTMFGGSSLMLPVGLFLPLHGEIKWLWLTVPFGDA